MSVLEVEQNKKKLNREVLYAKLYLYSIGNKALQFFCSCLDAKAKKMHPGHCVALMLSIIASCEPILMNLLSHFLFKD